MHPIDFINEFYQHIIQRNIEQICAHYAEGENTYVFVEGPRLSTLGSSHILKGWNDFCNSDIHLREITWKEGPYFEISDSMAWVAGIIHLQILVKEKYFENTFRASFVLIKQNGSWKIKHEHVSAAHPDPYGIGDWLKKT
ncbi:MAG: nuclear transport factor 2 family protein [Chitinophagaceae bacterium]|nr:nuclear transport factor 2 family protein [Chitinophagaceae bacterium]